MYTIIFVLLWIIVHSANVESDRNFAVFLMAYTLPMLYQKYEDQVDAVGEKALIEIKKQYKVIDAKLISKIPMLSEKKQH